MYEQLGKGRSTADVLREWCSHSWNPQSSNYLSGNPLHVLHYIIHCDHLDLLRVINEMLNDIQDGLVEDNKVETHADYWTSLVKRCERNLPEVQKSLTTLETAIRPGTNEPYRRTARQLSVRVNEETAITLKRLKIISKSLATGMAIQDSRRGISEAESVTKLTEFAFFFLPLTLPASLLSMQVNELHQGVPISVFFVLSVTLIVVAYSLRLVIRSRAVKGFRHRCWKQISEETEQGKQGFPVKSMPTGIVIQWLWKKFGKFILLTSAVTGSLLAPPAVLWTRDMDNGLRAVITFILLFVALILIFFFGIFQEIRSRFRGIRELFREPESVDAWRSISCQILGIEVCSRILHTKKGLVQRSF